MRHVLRIVFHMTILALGFVAAAGGCVFACENAQTGIWWDAKWSFRVPVSVHAAGHQRFAKPVEQPLNFTAMLQGLGVQAALDKNSLRVVEVDADGTILDASVPFQFDEAAQFDASVNASGTLVFILHGMTAAHATRYFHVYFDVAGKGFTPANVPSQVVFTDNVHEEGQAGYRVQTSNALYFYHKLGGGFSSLVDVNGRDWISYSTIAGSGGSYRGIPNMVYPEGYFHPGSTSAISSVVNLGPVKATIRSVTIDGRWETLWEIFPDYARMTVLKADRAYWFLYEGTPGGVLDAADRVTRANGVQTSAMTSWTGDVTNSEGEEWLYFTDPNVLGKARSLFVVHHEDDGAIDSYYPMNSEMTVFGFGRSKTRAYMTQVPNRFTVGLMDHADFAPAAAVIRSAFKDLDIIVGMAQKHATSTSSGTAIPPSVLLLLEERHMHE